MHIPPFLHQRDCAAAGEAKKIKYSDPSKPSSILPHRSGEADRSFESRKISRARRLKVGLANFSRAVSRQGASLASWP
jgi:hypothetical protein